MGFLHCHIIMLIEYGEEEEAMMLDIYLCVWMDACSRLSGDCEKTTDFYKLSPLVRMLGGLAKMQLVDRTVCADVMCK